VRGTSGGGGECSFSPNVGLLHLAFDLLNIPTLSGHFYRPLDLAFVSERSNVFWTNLIVFITFKLF
jgi:hypothetical protein